MIPDVAKYIMKIENQLDDLDEKLKIAEEALSTFASEDNWELVSGDDCYVANAWISNKEEPSEIAQKALRKIRGEK